MKTKNFIVLLWASFLITTANAQCPTNALITSAKKCIRLFWSTPPSPLPAYVIYNAVQYDYSSGSGTSGSPAEYIDPLASGACSSYQSVNSPITTPNGTICLYTGGLLPTTWLSVDYTLNNAKQSVLHWKVQETEIQKYELEISRDGLSFTTLATILNIGNGEHDYTYTDRTTSVQTQFYRVKQIAKNGAVLYSTVLKSEASNPNYKVVTYPNPATKHITISIDPSLKMLLNTNATITNIMGKQVGMVYLQNLTQKINLSAYLPGLYLLKLKDGSSSMFTILP
jgi:Secretion system C-terminal sorting domain